MDRGDIVDKVLRLLNYNMKNRSDVNKINYKREDVVDFVNRAYQQFMRDTGSGQRKTEIKVELDNDSSFYTPVNADRIENIYYLNEGVQLTIDDFEEVRRQFGRDWDTFTGLPQYATYLNTYKDSYLEGTEIKSPENDEIDISVLPTIKWEEREWRKNFQLQISTDEDFSTTEVDTTVLTTSYDVSSQLDFNTNYYIRVKAFDNKGNGIWSENVECKTVQGIASADISLLEKSNGLSLNNFRQFGIVKDSNGDMRFYYSGYTGSTNVCYIMTGKNFKNMEEYVSENTAGYRTALHTESLANSSDTANMCNLFYSEEDGQMYAIVSSQSDLYIEVWKISMPSDRTEDVSITQKSTNNIGGSGMGENYTSLQYLGNNILYDPVDNKYYRFRWDEINDSFSFEDISETLSGTITTDYKNCLITETEALRIPDGLNADFTAFNIIDRTSGTTQNFYTEDTYDFVKSYSVYLGKWAEFYFDDNGNKILYITSGYDTNSDNYAEQGILYRFLVS